MNDFSGQYAQALSSLYNQLKNQGEGGNVDLTNRPRVSPSDMAQVGYDLGGDNYATTHTATYSTPDGSKAINLTPIQAQNGQMKDIFEDSYLNDYANAIMAGKIKDNLGLQIGGIYNGNDAISKASADAERQHYLQEQYYALLKLAGLQ